MGRARFLLCTGFFNRAAMGRARFLLCTGFFNRAAMGRARFLLCTGFFFFRFRVTRRRPPRMMSSSTNCLHRMMSSSANYRPFLSSFRHISPSGGFCQVSELTVYTKNGGLRRWASGHLQG